MPRQTHANKALEGNEIEIARFYEQGKHLEDIALKFDVSSMTVHNWLKKLGYKHSKGRGRYPKAMPGRAMDLSLRGWSAPEISALLKVREDQVVNWVGSSGNLKENPRGFKRRSADEKDRARKKKIESLEKRRAKKGRVKEIPDPARLEEIESGVKFKRPKGRPPKEEEVEVYPPPRHRCNKHWTEPEERYVLELIREGKEPIFIYQRMRASRQRQVRIWRKYGGKGNPPNFPPPKPGFDPSAGPRPPKDGPELPSPAPQPPRPAVPSTVIEALSGELSDRSKAQAKLEEVRQERERLEKQADLEYRMLKKLKTSKEKREDILKSMIGDDLGDALSNRVIRGSYEHEVLGLRPGSRKPIELPSPEELASAKTEKKLKRLIVGAVRQIRHPSNRRKLATLLLDATLEYRSWLDRDDDGTEAVNKEVNDRRDIVVKVLEEIRERYEADQSKIEQMSIEDAAEAKKLAKEEEKKEKKREMELARSKRRISEAEEKTASLPKAPTKPRVDSIKMPTLLQFISIGAKPAIEAYQASDQDKERESVIEAVAPIYESEIRSLTKDHPDYREPISIAWESAYESILPRYAKLEDEGRDSEVTTDPQISKYYQDLTSSIKRANEMMSDSSEAPSEEDATDAPLKKKRKRSRELGPRPLRPSDYYAMRATHAHYADDGKSYRFGPRWAEAYKEGSKGRDIFASSTKSELKDLSKVLEQRFGFPNKLMTNGSLPRWWGSEDARVPKEVRSALTEAINSFPEIINRLRQRRDQLLTGKARDKIVRELKPKKPEKLAKESQYKNLDERIGVAKQNLEAAERIYEEKLKKLQAEASDSGRGWTAVDEYIRESDFIPVERAKIELNEREELARKRDLDKKRAEDYSTRKSAYEGELRKSIERKALTDDIASWVGKLGEYLKAKSDLESSSDPSDVTAPGKRVSERDVDLYSKMLSAEDSYYKIWKSMSEADRIILASNLKFADLRGRPTERGIRYAKYLSNKYNKNLEKNPGMPWIQFCKKSGLC